MLTIGLQFLTTFTVSLMKSLDIRSEPAVKLLAEFLDMDADMECPNPRANAEHFAHGEHIALRLRAFMNATIRLELYSYLRSPFRDLSVYDSVVQVCESPLSLLTLARAQCFMLISMIPLRTFHHLVGWSEPVNGTVRRHVDAPSHQNRDPRVHAARIIVPAAVHAHAHARGRTKDSEVHDTWYSERTPAVGT